MTEQQKRPALRGSPLNPKFLASIEHVGGQFTAFFEIHRFSRIDAGQHGPCSSYGAVKLWLESEARKQGMTVIWEPQSYLPARAASD